MKTKIYYLFLLFFSFVSIKSNELGINANISLSQNISFNKIYLVEGETIIKNLSLRYSVFNKSLENKNITLKCWMDYTKVGHLQNWTDISLLSGLSENIFVEFNLTIRVKRLGGSQLFCGIVMKKDKNDTFVIFEDNVAMVIVKRVPIIAELVFRIIVIIFVVFLTFVMGCGLEREIILNYLKCPISPIIGFICQFIFMPLMSLGLAKLTNIDNAFGFGLLTIGCSPGGGASNVWTVLFEGDLNLSMTMTFISSCSALFMMPFWLFVLGRFFIDPTVVRIPYQDIALNLLQVVIPVGFGMLFRWKFENKAIILAKKIKIMGLFFVIFLLTFGSYANFYIYELIGDYPYLLPIGAGLPWLGFLFGSLMSFVTRRDKKQTTAIAIETGFQNIGIALLILKFSMPQPGGDLGAVMPIIVALFTPIPLYIILIVLTIKRKCFDRKKKRDDVEINEIKNDKKSVLLDDKM